MNTTKYWFKDNPSVTAEIIEGFEPDDGCRAHQGRKMSLAAKRQQRLPSAIGACHSAKTSSNQAGPITATTRKPAHVTYLL